MCYSVQPRDQIFVRDYGFFSFAKNIGKNIGNNISKNLIGKYSQKHLHSAKHSATDLLQKMWFKKQQKQLVSWLVIKPLIKLHKSEKLYNKIVQIQLEISMIKKYLKREINVQRKFKKLSMIWINLIV